MGGNTELLVKETEVVFVNCLPPTMCFIGTAAQYGFQYPGNSRCRGFPLSRQAQLAPFAHYQMYEISLKHRSSSITWNYGQPGKLFQSHIFHHLCTFGHFRFSLFYFLHKHLLVSGMRSISCNIYIISLIFTALWIYFHLQLSRSYFCHPMVHNLSTWMQIVAQILEIFLCHAGIFPRP